MLYTLPFFLSCVGIGMVCDEGVSDRGQRTMCYLDKINKETKRTNKVRKVKKTDEQRDEQSKLHEKERRKKEYGNKPYNKSRKGRKLVRNKNQARERTLDTLLTSFTRYSSHQ